MTVDICMYIYAISSFYGEGKCQVPLGFRDVRVQNAAERHERVICGCLRGMQASNDVDRLDLQDFFGGQGANSL